ncbi:MAG: DUF1993 domain-containing protein [Candidatus Accumulibacter sp.]|jgi:hypothetical protein|nr:DUF1993 domain-containing protein [Accumulibacter sp.]
MTISMYHASVPVFERTLKNLSAILDKARARAEERKIAANVLPESRLIADMFPLSRQVQIASDHAKGAVARLVGVDNPKYEDNEQTIEDLQARVAKTVAFVETFTAAQIDGSEERDIVLALSSGEIKFKGMDYLLEFALPNFYFHVVTAYAILRQNGVEIGKRDFLGITR